MGVRFSPTHQGELICRLDPEALDAVQAYVADARRRTATSPTDLDPLGAGVARHGQAAPGASGQVLSRRTALRGLDQALAEGEARSLSDTVMHTIADERSTSRAGAWRRYVGDYEFHIAPPATATICQFFEGQVVDALVVRDTTDTGASCVLRQALTRANDMRKITTQMAP